MTSGYRAHVAKQSLSGVTMSKTTVPRSADTSLCEKIGKSTSLSMSVSIMNA